MSDFEDYLGHYDYDTDGPTDSDSDDRVNLELREERHAWETIENAKKIKDPEAIWDSLILCRNALTSVYKGKTFAGDPIEDFPRRLSLILQTIQVLLIRKYELGSYEHQIGYIVKYLLPKVNATKKDTIAIEILIRETIGLIKDWNLNLKLTKSSPKTHVLGQLSSLFITEPLIFKPLMTDGPVKDTQRGGECVSKVDDVSEVTVRNYGKFKIFKVPGTWIPESDDEGDDEEGEMEANESIYSEMVEEEGHRAYTVVTRP
jgi:hypothetical protein